MNHISCNITPRTTLMTICCLCASTLQAQPKKNVLFIVVDDLRPELGCYGSQQAITPHIDALGDCSVVYQHAYCNVPVSGASRASLLTGVYPNFSKKRFVDAETYSQQDLPGQVQGSHEKKNVAREKNYERLIKQFKSHLQTSMSNI